MKANLGGHINYQLRDARLESGLSQGKLAIAVGTNSDAISRYELSRTYPHKKRALKIAEILGKPVGYLFPRYIDNPNNDKNHSQNKRPSSIRLTRQIIKSLAVVDDELDESYLLRQRLNEALDILPYEEREIIILRYGLGEDVEKHKLREIGEIFGFTRETSRQKEAKALKKLRKAEIKARLECFLD